jgi:CDP-paratose 2-epimerase
MKYEYMEVARSGDHICYISDLSKMRRHYPQWDITKDLTTTLVEIHESWCGRSSMGRNRKRRSGL